MRLRNVKNANDIIENSDMVILDYKNYKGNYKELFKNNNPIYIEIGMGKGDFIIKNALNNPNINFIGIEKFDSVIVRAIQKANDLKLNNLKLIRMDAQYIQDVFYKEIDKIYLNFSDPWPKKRHSFRRLTHSNFLKKYDSIFKSENYIEFKTDNRNLFEFSIVEFVNYGYKIEKISLNLYEDDDINLNIPTEYETVFHNKGFPIYKIIVKK